MSKILDGNLVSKKIYQKIKLKIVKFKKIGTVPTLAVIFVGNNPASKLYVKIKEKKAEEIGIKTIVTKLSNKIKTNELNKIIKKFNNDKSIHGILVQLPLPKHVNTDKILSTINPKKDVDALNPKNKKILPPTPSAIIDILRYYKIEITNKNIVIIGYGKLVGKPLSKIIKKNKNNKLYILTSKTKNIKKYSKEADILICATGHPNLISSNDIKKGVVIIDAGVKKIKDKVQGDVNYKKVFNKCSYITPPTGGVGPVTVAKLLENVVKLTK